MADDREMLLTPDEVAVWLKVPRSWLYGRIHSRNLPFAMIKVGRYVRFPARAVEEFVENQLGNVAAPRERA